MTGSEVQSSPCPPPPSSGTLYSIDATCFQHAQAPAALLCLYISGHSRADHPQSGPPLMLVDMVFLHSICLRTDAPRGQAVVHHKEGPQTYL